MDESVGKKMPPVNREAEQAVIGSMLMERDAIIQVADILTKDDFYNSIYGLLFEAILALYNEGSPVDLLSVSAKLKEMGAPDEIYKLEFIGEIISAVPTAVHAEHYAKIVQDMATMRKMIRFMILFLCRKLWEAY